VPGRVLGEAKITDTKREKGGGGNRSDGNSRRKWEKGGTLSKSWGKYVEGPIRAVFDETQKKKIKDKKSIRMNLDLWEVKDTRPRNLPERAEY